MILWYDLVVQKIDPWDSSNSVYEELEHVLGLELLNIV